ncbi:MAG TPA: T9SS type A sorting domain-containing protein [Flavobacteriales bacterium]|nr:T9SS type A sorting domain-containing protein [Flavobacteriales bacterium]
MKNKLTSTVLLVIGFFTGHTQELSPQVIATSGETFTGPASILNWNLGELITETHASPGLILTQGFEQADVLMTSTERTGHEPASNNYLVSAYPNPASSVINVAVSNSETYQLIMTDVSGKTVYAKVFEGQNRQIDISGFENGMYMLTLHSLDHQILDKIKIVKNK